MSDKCGRSAGSTAADDELHDKEVTLGEIFTEFVTEHRSDRTSVLMSFMSMSLDESEHEHEGEGASEGLPERSTRESGHRSLRNDKFWRSFAVIKMWFCCRDESSR